jgi:hypothetical protein
MGLIKELPKRDASLFGPNRYPVFEYACVSFEYVVNGKAAQVHVPLPYRLKLLDLLQSF